MSQSSNLIIDIIIVFIGLGKWANDGLKMGIFLLYHAVRLIVLT